MTVVQDVRFHGNTRARPRREAHRKKTRLEADSDSLYIFLLETFECLHSEAGFAKRQVPRKIDCAYDCSLMIVGE
jgi:hypothetical protein